jgi:surface protein
MIQIGINIAVKGAQTSGTSAPVNTVSPVISGNTTIGSTLTLTSVGSYTGTAPITYAYQWYRGVTAIVGQTSTTYITQVADVGLQVICQVQASNAYGSAFASSNYIIPVALFTTTWTTTAPNQTITLPYLPTGIYSGTINWGDSTTSVNNGTVTTHTYATAGTYTVVINGNCDGWNFDQIGGSGFITSVEWWGQLKLTVGGAYNLGGYFGNCSNLDLSTVSDVLDLIGVTDMSQMFINCTSLTTISRINEWDTSAVQYMSTMFYGCTAFNQPLSFNTAAVNDMSFMFANCTAFNQALTFNTSAVTDMNGMFNSCTAFNQPLSFNTAVVTDMNAMFNSCSAFNSVLTFTSTSAVTDMSTMFSNCTSFNQPLTFNTAAVTDMNSMFNSCTAFNQPLTFNTSAVTDMNNMFNSCSAFNSVLTFTSTSAVTDMNGMFYACGVFNQALTFNTSAVTNMNAMFFNCTAFNKPLSFNTSAVDNMSYMFSGANSFNQDIGAWNVSSLANAEDFMDTKTPATFSTANLDAIYNGWSTTAGIILAVNISFGSAQYTSASASAKATLTTTYSWFITDGGLASAPFTSTWLVTAGETITLPYEAAGTYSGTINWGDSTTSVNSYANRTHTYATAGTKTISITDTTTGFRFNNTGSKLNIRTITNWGTLRLGNNNGYFYGCTNLTLTTVVGTLDLTGTTNMSSMFNGCSSLTTINGINSWNTASVTSMTQMFSGCSSISQPLSFNTAAVTDMNSMFFGCTSFNNTITFNTGLVTAMSNMFQNCTALNSSISFTSTANVTSMYAMFYNCTNFNQPLTFNTVSVTNMGYMFGQCAFNQNIGSWNVANVTDFVGFMANKTPATFSTTNLDAIYNGWVTVQSSRTISFGTAKYSAAGVAGRAYLTGTKLWTITDGGL